MIEREPGREASAGWGGEPLEAALAALGCGVWELRLPAGELLLRPGWAALVGVELPDEPLALASWLALTHPDDLEALSHHLAEPSLRAAGGIDRIHRLLHSEGRWIWARTRGRVTAWAADGTVLRLAGGCIDVTESVETRAALRAATSSLVQTHRIAGIGSFAIDPITLAMDAGRELGELLGSEPPRSAAGLAAMLGPPLDRLLNEAVERATREGVGWDLEASLRRADGSTRRVRIVGEAAGAAPPRPVELRCVLQDISEVTRRQKRTSCAFEPWSRWPPRPSG